MPGGSAAAVVLAVSESLSPGRCPAGCPARPESVHLQRCEGRQAGTDAVLHSTLVLPATVSSAVARAARSAVDPQRIPL